MVGAGTGGPVSNYVLIVRDIRKLHGIESFHLNLLPALVTQDVHSEVCPMCQTRHRLSTARCVPSVRHTSQDVTGEVCATCQTDASGRPRRGVFHLSDTRHRTSPARCVPSVRHTPQDVHGGVHPMCQTHATGRPRRGVFHLSDTRHRTSTAGCTPCVRHMPQDVLPESPLFTRAQENPNF